MIEVWRQISSRAAWTASQIEDCAECTACGSVYLESLIDQAFGIATASSGVLFYLSCSIGAEGCVAWLRSVYTPSIHPFGACARLLALPA